MTYEPTNSYEAPKKETPLKYFKHYNAVSIDQVLSLLRDYDGKANLIAGGTDLLGVLKDDFLPTYPEAVINIKTIPGLDHIREDQGGLKIGALTKLVDIARSPIMKNTYKILAEAAESVASPEIRNMGTIGGNLCQDTRCWYYRYPHSLGGRIPCFRKGKSPCPAIRGDNRYHALFGGKKCFAVCPSDMAIALAALDAEISVASRDGERTVSVIDFYETLGPILKPAEMVTEIHVPRPSDQTTQSFLKFRLRESVDFAVVSLASAIRLNAGVCHDARIVLGAVAPTPYRARAAEEAVKGEVPEPTVIERAGRAAVSNAKPLSRNAYKIEIIKTLVKRALLG
jgi:xanthine dehydrogenase YagS FAD-binding subunit